MRNREATLRKIDQINSNLNKLSFYLSRGDRESYDSTFESLHEQLDQLRTYVESEPIAGSELNNPNSFNNFN